MDTATYVRSSMQFKGPVSQLEEVSCRRGFRLGVRMFLPTAKHHLGVHGQIHPLCQFSMNPKGPSTYRAHTQTPM